MSGARRVAVSRPAGARGVPRWLGAALLAGLAGLGPPPRPAAAQEHLAEYDAALLQRHGVVAEREPLGRLLDPQPLTAEQAGQIAADVRSLAAPEFLARQAASERLVLRGAAARPALETALGSRDAEVRYRARHLLARIERESSRDLSLRQAALRVIGRERIGGLVPVLVEILPRGGSPQEREAVREALFASARPEDLPRLAEAAGAAPHPLSRAAALEAAGRISPPEELRALLDAAAHDGAEEVRLAAAAVRLERGEPAPLLELGELLSAERPHVRHRAVSLLQAYTGEAFHYGAFDPPEQRAAAAEAWRAALAARPPGRPLPPPPPREIPTRLLLCHFNPFSVSEYSIEGKRLYASTSLQSACGCAGSPEGTRYYGDWGANQIVAYDPRGVETLRLPLPGTPNGLDRLAGGNLLVPLFDRRRVVEFEPGGRVAWEAEVAGAPTDARRLANGRTLVPLHSADRVVEIDSAGREAWRADGIPSPESARRLASGHTLVACSRAGKVVELDPAGRVVWECEAGPTAYDALELPWGTILIAHNGGLSEVDRGGAVVREISTTTVRRICAY